MSGKKIRYIGNVNDCSGKVLLRVIICLVTLLVVGVFIAVLLRTYEQRNLENHRKALTICEYGLLKALQKIEDEPSWRDGFQNKTYIGGAYEVIVDSQVENGTLRLKLKSVGEMGSVKKNKECILRLRTSDGDSSWVRESMM
ncbi:MAG: hypothetical protein ACLFQB_01155 [Chitinispirillaceae bacterium]